MGKAGSLPIESSRQLTILPCLALLLAMMVLLPNAATAAVDSVCAQVKIEIRQELTLERQAFDARMRIHNGLSRVPLENIDVTVAFKDADGQAVIASSDPDHDAAMFFIRLDAMENVGNVSGAGTVAPSTTADIHWLIIPATGAAGANPAGTLYYVGAKLTYTIGGEENVTEVTPDYIFVKPLPDLLLDYFIPGDVYGDDPFTDPIEPPVPFTLGVRVQNIGHGRARSLKIDSAQPNIIENNQGLLVGFTIEGAQVNEKPVNESLLVNFGDLASNEIGMARWIMSCTLSGKFIEFDARVSHSDELGGELTSLIKPENTRTHFLVKDVLVDLPGRDSIRDFLAKDGDVLNIYESDSGITAVAEGSSESSLTNDGGRWQLTAPVSAGCLYVKLPDPFAGVQIPGSVLRSDGKQIKPENFWLSKTRDGDHWQHYVNLFDVNTTGSYTVAFDDVSSLPQAPVLQTIADRTTVEDRQISFVVEASDPDRTIPALAAAPLPVGAVFDDQGDGTALFDWVPTQGQAGSYEIAFSASDGRLQSTQRARITVFSIDDTDGDGLLDSWEMANFGTLERDGQGDYDKDGIPDRLEFKNQTDPTQSNAPTVPQIASPENHGEVSTEQPTLVVYNSSDPDGDNITYRFELFADSQMTDLVADTLELPQADSTTAWTIPVSLEENAIYYWRVRASDGIGHSEWAHASFFVNVDNEPPAPFAVSRPQSGTEVSTAMPILEVTNSADVDRDALVYIFEVFDAQRQMSVVSSEPVNPGEDGTTAWTVNIALVENTEYVWYAVAVDEHGLETSTETASFFVNQSNDPPSAPVILFPDHGSELAAHTVTLQVQNGLDPENDALFCSFEIDTLNTFDSAERQQSGPIPAAGETTSWAVPIVLEENSYYHWRAKNSDGAADSGWAQGRFFVNANNEAPAAPVYVNPGDESWVSTVTPQLELLPLSDPDEDVMTYEYEIYGDAGLTELLRWHATDSPTWTVEPPLEDNTWYFWRARAFDEHDQGPWQSASAFFTDSNGTNDEPQIDLVEPSEKLVTGNDSIQIRWEDIDPDSNADIALYFEPESGGEGAMRIDSGIKEDPDADGDGYLWDISGLSEGIYYLYAVIADEVSEVESSPLVQVVIDRTEPTIEATPPGGTYDAPQTVTLAVDEPATIYFTLDGSVPTTDSAVYTAPLIIDATTTLQCMAVDQADNRSVIVSETYTIAATANEPPVADAGADFTMRLGGTAYLDAFGSYDPDNSPAALEYHWRFANLPAGSGLEDASIATPGQQNASFRPDVVGSYAVELTVYDGQYYAADTVVVTCEKSPVDDPYRALRELLRYWFRKYWSWWRHWFSR